MLSYYEQLGYTRLTRNGTWSTLLSRPQGEKRTSAVLKLLKMILSIISRLRLFCLHLLTEMQNT